MTIKRIKIAYLSKTDDAPESFRVVFVKNSTEFMPGQYVARRDVEDLCRRTTWDVTIVEPRDPGMGWTVEAADDQV